MAVVLWTMGPCVAFADAGQELLPAIHAPGPYTVAGAVPQNEQACPRVIYGMNLGWRYADRDERSPGDRLSPEHEPALKPNHDVSGWKKVNLPYRVKSAEKLFALKFYYLRKTFVAPQELAGRSNYLYFEGLPWGMAVWLNGHRVSAEAGISSGAWALPRVVDVSQWIKPGELNVLVLDSVAPAASMGIREDGGLHHLDAYLISTGETHIACRGVFFRTEQLNAKKKTATVSVKATVVNDSAAEKKIRVQVLMTDPKAMDPVGDAVSVLLPPHSRKEVEMKLELEKARLWSPRAPNLYRLAVELWTEAEGDAPVELLDSHAMRVGVCTREVTDKGVVWNGELREEERALQPKGGLQWTPKCKNLEWLTVKRLHEAGICKIEMMEWTGDAPNDALLDACDKLGVIVQLNAGCYSGEPAWHQCLENHPSVVFAHADIRRASNSPPPAVRIEKTLPVTEPNQLRLIPDMDDELPLTANGSDIWQACVTLTDGHGRLLPLRREDVRVSLEGPAELLREEDAPLMTASDRLGVWFRVGTTPGRVKVRASTLHPDTKKELSAVLEFDTVPAAMKMIPATEPAVKQPPPAPPQPRWDGLQLLKEAYARLLYLFYGDVAQRILTR